MQTSACKITQTLIFFFFLNTWSTLTNTALDQDLLTCYSTESVDLDYTFKSTILQTINDVV